MARLFNGTNSLESASNPAALNVADNGPIAVCGWINVPSVTALSGGVGQTALFGRGYDGKTAYGWALQDFGGGVIGPTFSSFDGSASHGFTTPIPYSTLGWTANTWHFVYGDYDGTTWRRAFDSGVLDSFTVTDHGPYSNTAKFVIGAVDANGTTVQFSAANIADVAVFNGPLTAPEILALATLKQRPCPGRFSKTLLGYWPVAGWSPEIDQSGNNNHLTVFGTSYVADPPYVVRPLPAIGRFSANPVSPTNDPNPTVTLGADCGDGSLLVLTGQGTFANDITSVVITDDVSGSPNTYAVLDHSYDPTLKNVMILAVCHNSRGLRNGNKIKFALSDPQIHFSILVEVFYPVGDWKLQGFNKFVSSSSSNLISSGSITTTKDQCLIYGVMAVHGPPPGTDTISNGNVYPGAGFANGILVGTAGTHYSEFLMQSVAGPVDAQFINTAGNQVMCYVVAFEPYGFVGPTQTNFNPTEIVNPGNTITLPIFRGPVAAGRTLMVSFGWSTTTAPGTITITDNAVGFTNTYAVIQSQLILAGESFGFAACTNVQGNPTTVTVAFGGLSAGAQAIIGHVDEYAGSWNYTGQHGTGSSSSLTSIPTTPALTPTKNGALFFQSTWNNSANSQTTGGGTPFFQLRSNQLVVANTDYIQPTAAAVTPSTTLAGSGSSTIIVTALFEPVTASPTVPTRTLTGVGP